MPNRILKESICTSDTISKLSFFEEVCFYRLIVNADDYGRFDGRLAILKSRMFPLESITEKQIGDAIDKLSSVGIVTTYIVEGKPYLQIVTWADHQQVRNKRSKYPSIEDGISETDNTCNQLISIDCKSPRNPIQSNPNPNPNLYPSTDTQQLIGAFELFWKSYPRKVGKKAAREIWVKLEPDAVFQERIIKAVKEQAQSDQWTQDEGRFIPNPETWLNQGRWDDVLPKPGKGSKQQRDNRANFTAEEEITGEIQMPRIVG